jgi:hypothetical protein
MRLLKLKPNELMARSQALDGLGRFYRRAWSWLAELRGSTPALALAPASGRPPRGVRADEVIEGRRAAGESKTRRQDEYHVFRHWNDAAYRAGVSGFPGFMEVMREGSESYARTAFAEDARLRGAA